MTVETGRPQPSLNPPDDLPGVVAEACGIAGYPAAARLLRHFANAVYVLQDTAVVVRVSYGSGAVAKATTSIAVTRWLATQGFPTIAPTDPPSEAAQPVVVTRGPQQVAVTFWTFHPQPADHPGPDAAILGATCHRLHRLPASPVPLPSYRPLRSLEAAVLDPASGAVLGPIRRAWLLERIASLRHGFSNLSFPLGHGLIHADMYPSNLLWSDRDPAHPVLLGDWDSVSHGPREIDLIPIYHEPRFGVSNDVIDQFAAAYGYDLSRWNGFPVLYDIRELSTLTALIQLAPTNPASAAELTHRLNILKTDDRTTLWHAQ